MDDCIFCKIIRGEIPSQKVYEDEYVYAFNDINPAAALHILVIPKTHISNLLEIGEENCYIISKIFVAITKIALQKGMTSGFRVVSNCNEYGGQTVFHLHFHLIGGEKLSLNMV